MKVGMRRKKHHCKNKQEVLEEAWQQATGKPESFMKKQMRMLNKIKQKQKEKH